MTLLINEFSKIYSLCHEHQAKIHDKNKLNIQNQMAFELFFKLYGYLDVLRETDLNPLSNELVNRIFSVKDIATLKKILSESQNDWEFPILIGASYDDVSHIIFSIEAIVVGDSNL